MEDIENEVKEYFDKKFRVSKLDSTLLFFCSSLSLLFGLLQSYFGGIQTLIYFIPILIIGWFLPIYIGYIRGALLYDSVTDRAVGWIYFLFGSIFYVINLLKDILKEKYADNYTIIYVINIIPFFIAILISRYVISNLINGIFKICNKEITANESEMLDYVSNSAFYLAISGEFLILYLKNYEIIYILLIIILILSGSFLLYIAYNRYYPRIGKKFTITIIQKKPKIAKIGKIISISSLLVIVFIYPILDITNLYISIIIFLNFFLLVIGFIIFQIYSNKKVLNYEG
jgi:hypothetical protein